MYVQKQTRCSHNRKGVLKQLQNCQVFKGILFNEFIQWLHTYHKHDTVRVYNINICFLVAIGYVHGFFHRTVRLHRIWMLNAARNHFHSWKKNLGSSVWFLQSYDTYLAIIILGGRWTWKVQIILSNAGFPQWGALWPSVHDIHSIYCIHSNSSHLEAFNSNTIHGETMLWWKRTHLTGWVHLHVMLLWQRRPNIYQ
jgi:hypothetical protein